jgi:Ca2+-transporting ATPase
MVNSENVKDAEVVKNSKKVAFETLEQKETISFLNSNKENGLTSEEAKDRLAKLGPNKLVEKKKKSRVRIFFEQMNNPMIFVLFAAIAITVGVSIYETIQDGASASFLDSGDWPDVIIIMGVVVLNSIIGTVEEVKAQTSLEALKKLSSPESTVIRDGKRIKVKSEDLVVGDIVVLEEGDTIGADLRLLESFNLKVNESSLTGESTPVEKSASLTFSSSVGIGDRLNMAYMSTPVTYGRGLGIVVATAMDTEIGKIANALEGEEDSETPLQKVLAKLSKTLGILTLLIVIIVLAADIIWIFVDGQGNQIEAWIESILTAIALAVAAIPEGLPAVVTIVLSIGMRRMVSANTIVRKLPSVETLGAVSVVCSDKTGTLTQNKMTVVSCYVDGKVIDRENYIVDSKDEDVKFMATGFSLCSNATVDEGLYGDPTEIALVLFANAFGLNKKKIEGEHPRVDELPFDSVRKMMSTMNVYGDKKYIFTKGALDSILAHSTRIYKDGKILPLTKEDRDEINKVNDDFSLKALRVLALAYKESDKIVEDELIFVGLVAMIDPPRPEAKPAVQIFKDAGITTVMITGDHKETAFAIAKNLGIATSLDQCVLGSDVDKMDEDELRILCRKVRVFARVSPQNKVDIVKAFKANGNICAMTGDGVNDAPSLKSADIGIAMGITGTDVAKGAADMVLTDDNFASIEKAVAEGRGIYANIKKTVIFLLSSNIAEVLAMFIIICIGFPAPLIAIHLLWVNLITDSLPAVALGMDPKDPNIMEDKPRDPKEGIFARGGGALTLGFGAVITIATLIAYFSCGWLNGVYGFEALRDFYNNNPDMLHQAQTMAFTTLAVSELFHMLGVSNFYRSFIHIFKKKNTMMYVAFFAGIALQLFVIEVPGVNLVFDTYNIDWKEWLITCSMSVLPLVAHEIFVFFYRLRKKIVNKKVA